MPLTPTDSVKKLFIFVLFGGIAVIAFIGAIIPHAAPKLDAVTAFQNIQLGCKYEEARKILKAADFYQEDYLTPNDDDSYDCHWLYKNDTESPTQIWINLTCNGTGKDKIIRKTLQVRTTP